MKKILLAFLVISFSIFANEGLIPVSYEGRFIPLENLPADAPKNILPSRKSPLIWLEVEALLESQKNISLFTEQEWKNLQRIYLDEGLSELFAKEYFKAYTPLTLKAYPLSERASLSFPSIYQLKAERFYRTWPLLSIATALYLGALLFLLLSLSFKRSFYIGTALFLLAFLTHTLALILRIYILERPPVSNMAETAIYVPWIGAVVGALFSLRFKSPYPLLAAVTLSVILLTILEWTFGNPSLSNVQAVLNSRFWLTIHVLMIVGSYGIFLLAGILGHFYLILQFFQRKADALPNLIIKSLYIGVALLIPGTILGGVWAAQSWGRFWDWDPKESWALISAAFYLLTIHAHRFGIIGNFGIAVGSIVGLMAISFTWYGVNYILGTGLHSYGFGEGGEWIYYSYLAVELAFICFASISNREKTKNFL